MTDSSAVHDSFSSPILERANAYNLNPEMLAEQLCRLQTLPGEQSRDSLHCD